MLNDLPDGSSIYAAPLVSDKAGAVPTDTQRLQFLIDKGAHVGWNREGDYCGVWVDGEEGETECLSGWGAFHEDPRAAIDAAMNKAQAGG